jgi:acyl carrier protein
VQAKTAAEIEHELRTFLLDNFPLYGSATIEREASLVESGVIDSLGVLEVVEFVESRFGVRVSEDELLPENLDSVANVTGYVSRKLGRAVP